MPENELVDWLMDNAGPIIRYRTATELIGDVSESELKRLQEDLLGCEEVLKWLQNLESCTHVHSSKDIAAENCIGKLVAYGLSTRIPEFQQLIDSVYARIYTEKSRSYPWEARILFPFLVSAGYTGKEEIAEYAISLLNRIHGYASESLSTYRESDNPDDLFYSHAEKERLKIPAKWRDKHVWKQSLEDLLPNCFDYYLLSHLSGNEQKRHAILEFTSTDRFQELCRREAMDGSYNWNGKNYCAGVAAMPYFHGYAGFDEPGSSANKFLMYMDLTARFPGASGVAWFKNGINHLEQYRLETGRYRFPSSYVLERKNSYLLYTGAHMRLGEKGKKGLEVESTFRMLSLKTSSGLL